MIQDRRLVPREDKKASLVAVYSHERRGEIDMRFLLLVMIKSIHYDEHRNFKKLVNTEI